MKERPILFSAPMVKALLAGRKTQTRRVINTQPRPSEINGRWQWAPPTWFRRQNAMGEHGFIEFLGGSSLMAQCCPYGKPGDLLWVRETWAPSVHAASARFDRNYPVVYAASDSRSLSIDGKWRPSIRMPRWASRLTLRITDVRVEQLQQISGMDAKREGAPVPAHLPEDGADLEWARGWYRLLWDEINGDGAWDTNPWVWVISFEAVTCAQCGQFDFANHCYGPVTELVGHDWPACKSFAERRA